MSQFIITSIFYFSTVMYMCMYVCPTYIILKKIVILAACPF